VNFFNYVYNDILTADVILIFILLLLLYHIQKPYGSNLWYIYNIEILR